MKTYLQGSIKLAGMIKEEEITKNSGRKDKDRLKLSKFLIHRIFFQIIFINYKAALRTGVNKNFSSICSH